MDFIRQNIKKFNLLNQNELGLPVQFPNIEKTQIEKLHENIYKSLKERNQDLNSHDNDDQIFENLAKQSKGIQSINGINIKGFERKFKDINPQ